MNELRWDYDGKTVTALSVMHDDGDHFTYEFFQTAEGWENYTTEELILGPTQAFFTTLDAAKAWAQQTENEWIRTTPVEIAQS